MEAYLEDFDIAEVDKDIMDFFEENGLDDEEQICSFLSLVMQVSDCESVDSLLLEISDELDEENMDGTHTSELLEELRRIAGEI